MLLSPHNVDKFKAYRGKWHIYIKYSLIITCKNVFSTWKYLFYNVNRYEEKVFAFKSSHPTKVSSIFTRHNSKSSNIITRFLISTCKYTWKRLVIAIMLSHCNLKAYFYPFFLFLNLAAVSFRSCQAGILLMSDGVFLQQACDGLWAVGRYKQVDLSLFFDELRCGRLP